MNKNKKQVNIIIIVFIVLYILLSVLFEGNKKEKSNKISYNNNNTSKTFKIISSSENEELENVIKSYAEQKGYDIDIDYSGTLDIMQKLNNGEKYDAVWACSSILHSSSDELVIITKKIWTALKDNGIFYTSFKYGNLEGERNFQHVP